MGLGKKLWNSLLPFGDGGASGGGNRPMAEELRTASVERWRADSLVPGSAFSPELVWRSNALAADRMMARLDQALRTAAGGGCGSFRLCIMSFPGSEVKNGFVFRGKHAADGEANLMIWSFPVRRGCDVEMVTLDTAEKSDAFEELVARKVCEHLVLSGLDARWRKSLGGHVVEARWFGEGEAESVKKALGICGGYEAMRAGVPVDDIIA